jgi:hypothetical protein
MVGKIYLLGGSKAIGRKILEEGRILIFVDSILMVIYV